MFSKHALIDLAIVLTVPIIIIGGYFLFGDRESPIISIKPDSVVGLDQAGEKTKLALVTLKGINLNGALFEEEAFTSLKYHYVSIPEASTSRAYPFTSPPIIEERLRQVRLGQGKTGATAPVKTVNTKGLDAKIDQLRRSMQ